MVCVSIRNDFVSWQLTRRFAAFVVCCCCWVFNQLGCVFGVCLNYQSNKWEKEMTLLWEAIH